MEKTNSLMIPPVLLFSLNVNCASFSKKVEANDLPYTCNLVTQELFATWNVMNANKFTKTWVKNTEKESVSHSSLNKANADNRLISSSLGIEGGKKCRFKYPLNQNSFRTYQLN